MYERGTDLFRQDATPTKTYLILLGTVNLYDSRLNVEEAKKEYKHLAKNKSYEGLLGQKHRTGKSSDNSSLCSSISDSSYDSQDVEDKDIDSTINLIYDMKDICFESVQAGNVLGKMDENISDMYKEKKRAFTAKCKSDVLLLEMDLNVFEVLKEQRIKKDQENLLKAVVTTMPFIKEFYTGFKLI